MTACTRCGGTGKEADGAVLRSLREGLDMGLREMARAIHYSHTYLSHVELGRRAVTAGHLELLSKVYAAAGRARRRPLEPHA